MKLKDLKTARGVTEVGPGDYIKVCGAWVKIESNTAFGETRTPKNWVIKDVHGGSYGMFDVSRYAKAGDLVD